MRRAIGECLWRGEPAAAIVDVLARQCGLETAVETEAVDVYADRVAETLRLAAPAVVDITGGGHLAVVTVDRGSVQLLTPGLRVVRVPLAEATAVLCEDAEAPHVGDIDRLLETCGVTGRKRQKARAALLRERVKTAHVGRAVQVRVSPGASFAGQVRDAGLLSRLVLFAGVHAVEFALWLAAWWLLGMGALSGRIDMGWLSGWALLLVTMAPLHMAMLWLQGRISIGIGGLLKQRLLVGALRLKQDVIRREGSGQLLGRVIESETVEALALGGGLSAVAAAIEIVLAAGVLVMGAGGWKHGALLAVWVGATVLGGVVYYRRRLEWTTARLRMTDDLVERMGGHRTRLAQEPPSEWHRAEDAAVDSYFHTAWRMDSMNAALFAAVPRTWLIVGLAGLVPAFIAATGDAVALAIGLGGVVLAHRALRKLCSSIGQLVGAVIAWRAVKPLFDAAAAPSEARENGAASAVSSTVIDAQDLTFRYHGRGEAVLKGVNVRVERGDRVLLEGESGGGKSTLASLLVGLRDADSGVLLAGGLDKQTLGGSGWRKRVVAAPQYHENHILSAPLAFNLLMGRAWPPSQADLVEAEQVCRELGLGGLLDRMPAGIMQMVGETGWQPSQGERSRIFMARALLQKADLVVLDESFAALDPENLQQSLECVLKRAETLLVVAHP